MNETRPLRWPWAISIAAILVLTAAIVLTILNDTFGLFVVIAGMMVIGYGTVGAFLATRVPHNPIGWLMIVIAASFAIVGVADEYLTYTLTTNVGALPLPEVAAVINGFVFYGVFIPLLVILLLFPTGTLLSPRWRIVLATVLISGGLLILSAIVTPGQIGGDAATVDNPLGVEALRPVIAVVNWIAGLALILGSIASVVAVAVRYRRAEGDERRQIGWLAWVAALAIVILIVGLTLSSVFSAVESFAFTALFAVIGIGVPLAIQNAIMRHRLYDLDVVIKKTVVFAIVVVLLVGIGGIVAVLVGVGIVPSLSDSPALMLFLGLAYGLMVTPAYRLASRIADRVVYGGRASPSEVLSEFSERLSETYATDDVLPRMAAIVGEATRAKEVRVWLRVSGVFRMAASWPAGLLPEDPVADAGGALPRFPDDGHRTEVRDRGELLGAITTSFHANDPIDQSRERLIRDMAAQAGSGAAQRGVDREPPSIPPADGRRPGRGRGAASNATSTTAPSSSSWRCRCKTAAGRHVDRPRHHEGARDAGADPSRHERRAGDPPRPRTRDLPAAARRQGPGGGAGRAGTEGRGAGEVGRRRHRTLSGRSGGDRVLLRPGGHAERVEVRAGIGDRASAANVQRLPDLRGSGRRGGLRSTDAHAGHGHPGDAGPAGRRRRARCW